MRSTTEILIVCLMVVGSSGAAMAQHSDLEFGYEGGKIITEGGEFGGTIFEAEFPTSGADEQFTDDPGIASEIDEGFGVNPGDEIYYNILGPLEYFDPITEGLAPVPVGVQIRIENVPGTVPDTIVTGSSGPILANFTTGQNRIGAAELDGDFHSHVDFFLEPLTPDPPAGAYALLMSLSTDEPGIADSDPFRIVFNFGMDEEDFEEAVGVFAVPEPSTYALAAIAFVGMFASRRGWRGLWNMLGRSGSSRAESRRIDDLTESESDADEEDSHELGRHSAADAAHLALRNHIAQRNKK